MSWIQVQNKPHSWHSYDMLCYISMYCNQSICSPEESNKYLFSIINKKIATFSHFLLGIINLCHHLLWFGKHFPPLSLHLSTEVRFSIPSSLEILLILRLVMNNNVQVRNHVFKMWLLKVQIAQLWKMTKDQDGDIHKCIS